MGNETTDRFRRGLIYLFAAIATAGIGPFAVMRYLNGELIKAALDAGVVIAMIANAYYIRGKANVVYNSAFVSGCYSLAAVAVIYLNTPTYIFWLHTITLGNFFLLRANLALAINIATVIAILPAAFHTNDIFITAGMIASLLFCGGMAYVFARLTDEQRELLNVLATQDALTHLGNRRSMDMEMRYCIDDFQRDAVPACIILLDIDKFKVVNDVFGHKVGDELLVAIAKLLTKRARKTDRLFRFGGEEFLLLARRTTLQQAETMAQGIRQQVEAKVKSPSDPITISLGCAQLKQNESPDQWFERADLALYRAKGQGRNCVVLAD